MTHSRRGRLTRRRFLALSASAAALAAVPVAAQTRRGGTFISAKTTEAPSLDPIMATRSGTNILHGAFIYSNLSRGLIAHDLFTNNFINNPATGAITDAKIDQAWVALLRRSP